MKDHRYTFTAKVWIYPGPSTWHLVSLPKELSKELSKTYQHLKAGFGSLPVDVTYKNITWRTSIFPERKESRYMLPLKKEVRKRGKIKTDDEVELEILIRVRGML